MLRIAMTCFNVEGRGTYLRAFKFATELKKLGHSPTVIATNRSGFTINEKIVHGVEVVTFPDLLVGPLRSGWDAFDALLRVNWLRKRKFDIVHAFESRPTAILPALYLHNQGAALYTDWCDWFGMGGAVEERPNPIIRSVLRPIETFFEEHYRIRAKGTTVICTTLKNKALQLGIPLSKIRILPNGLDDSDIHPIPSNEARRLLGLPDSDFIIGYLGASFFRDAQLMMNAFLRIRKMIPHAKLLQIGRSNYEVLRGKDIRITGEVSQRDLNLFLSACDICWLPLRNSNANHGRFPLKISNYLAAGKPVVATNVGDLGPFITQNSVGLISEDTPNAIAENAFRLFNQPDLIREYSENALNLVKDPHYSWARRTRELEDMYNDTYD